MFSALVALTLTASPELVLLSSRADSAELRFQPIGTPLVEPVVRFSHGEGSDVFGALLPGTRVVVATVATRSTGDLSFANALLRLEAGKPARVLADQLVYASRPVVTAEGRVFMARGTPGTQVPDRMRVDALTVEEIDPVTAKTRLVFSAQGFETHVVGALGRELIIYEVTPAGARLLAVHVDTLGVRVVLRELVAMARDFVVDAPRKRVLFTQVRQDGWYVEQVSLVDGARRSLAEGPEVTLLPTVLSDGRVLISAGAGKGLRALDGKTGLPAQGSGFERVRLETGGLLIGLHERPSEFPSLFVFQRGEGVTVAAPVDARLDIAGVIP